MGQQRLDVKGPLTRDEYEGLRATLRLPNFSKTYHVLWQRTGE